MLLGHKIQEFIYSLSTKDKYSEFDSRKSFNRVNKPDTEDSLLYSHHDNQELPGHVDDDDTLLNLDGVHEVKLAWRHIKLWLQKNSPDINSSLQDKCTSSDLAEFQKDLAIRLPNCVIEFFKQTDGQSNFGTPTTSTVDGLVFGLKLMSLDEILIMTENWRKVARVLNTELSQVKMTNSELSRLPTSHNNFHQVKKKFTSTPVSSTRNSLEISASNSNGMNSRSSSGSYSKASNSRYSSISQPKASYSRSSSTSSSSTNSSNTSTFHNMPKQRSIPLGTIHETFAHPMWIPIITDEVGNYIGIDLSPPQNGSGKIGQVILFGREFDFKFQIADNFGDFLLIFANDLEMGNWTINSSHSEDDVVGREGSLVFVDRETKLEAPYLDVLKRRCIKKWIQSLPQDIDLETKQVILELRVKDTNGSYFKNLQSVDKSINQELATIDSMNNPINDSGLISPISYSRSSISSLPPHNNIPSFKSPLSKELGVEGIDLGMTGEI